MRIEELTAESAENAEKEEEFSRERARMSKNKEEVAADPRLAGAGARGEAQIGEHPGCQYGLPPGHR